MEENLPAKVEETKNEETVIKLNHVDEIIAFKASLGMSSKKIALEIGLAYTEVDQIIQREDVQKTMAEYRWKLFGKNVQKRIESLVPRALDALSELLNKEDVKDSVKLQVVKEVLDRSLGKPNQKIEVSGSLIKDLYSMLDDMKDAKKSTITIENLNENIEDAILVEKKENVVEHKHDSSDKEKLDVDNWIKNNLG